MQEYIVLTLVVVISIAAHVWLFAWIKFRIDESVVVKCLEDEKESEGLSAELIAERSNYKPERVVAVCEKSAKVCNLSEDGKLWSLA